MINNEKDMLNDSENISEAFSIQMSNKKTEVIAKTQLISQRLS